MLSNGERADRVTERGVPRSRTFYVSKSSKVRGFRRGEPMRVPSVQLGGSLAGKLSSKLSSILSSVVAAAGGSGWRLRRASADARRCCGMDRGIMSPAASWRSHKYSSSTRPTRRARAHDTPPARGGTLLANAIGAASIASTDLAHFPFEVNALSDRLTSPLGTRARDMAALESGERLRAPRWVH